MNEDPDCRTRGKSVGTGRGVVFGAGFGLVLGAVSERKSQG